jgi:hypothetical protein
MNVRNRTATIARFTVHRATEFAASVPASWRWNVEAQNATKLVR